MKIKLTDPSSKKSIRFVLPGSFSELNSDQLTHLAFFVNTAPKHLALINFILYLSNLVVVRAGSFFIDNNSAAWVVRRKWHTRRYLVCDRDLMYLISLLDWMFDNDQLNITLSNFPSDSKYVKRLVSPGPAFTTLSYEQYTHADTHFSNFYKSKDFDELFKMICALCASNFHTDTYLDNLAHVRRFNRWYCMVIFWYFIGSKKVIAKVFPNLFSIPDNTSASADSDVYLQYMSLTSAMCDSPSEISNVKIQLAWDVFSFLEEKIKANKRAEEQLKKYK